MYFDSDQDKVLLVIRGRELNLEDVPREVLAAILSAQGDKSIYGGELLQLEGSGDRDKVRAAGSLNFTVLDCLRMRNDLATTFSAAIQASDALGAASHFNGRSGSGRICCSATCERQLLGEWIEAAKLPLDY